MDIVNKFCESLYRESEMISDIYVQAAYMDVANYIAGCDIHDAIKRLQHLQGTIVRIQQELLER